MGQYDKLVSIEMIEAVGHDFYDDYFGKCGALLKPDGLMLLQAITIADQRYDAARRSVDFIQRYIFPGSCIPSVTAMNDSITRASDLQLVHLEDIGPHYATTLRQWRENFFAQHRGSARPRLPGGLHPHVGVLSVLLRRRLRRTCPRRRSPAAGQTR